MPGRVALIAGLLFVELAWWAVLLGTRAWERRVVASVAGWPDAAGVVLRPAMELGNRGVAVLVAALVWAAAGRRHGVRTLVSAGAAWALALVGKAVVDRPRPTAADLGADPRQVVDGAGFPSSHTAIAFALAVAVVVAFRPGRPVTVGVFALAGLTGLARLHVGVHFPLDVLGGALAGVAAAGTVAYVADRRQRVRT